MCRKHKTRKEEIIVKTIWGNMKLRVCRLCLNKEAKRIEKNIYEPSLSLGAASGAW